MQKRKKSGIVEKLLEPDDGLVRGTYVLMAADYCCEEINVPELVTALLHACSAVSEYRLLRDLLPERLTALLRCRCVLFYQCIDESLQFVAGASDELPGWSSALLCAAHINPLELDAALPEARAWRERRSIATPAVHPTLVALPLLYRHQPIGVLVALSQFAEEAPQSERYWHESELQALEAVASVVALLLEHARLLEQDRARIDELSLLNRTASQLYAALHDPESMRQIIARRVHEITGADQCEVVLDTGSMPVTPSGDLDSHSTWLSPTLATLLYQACSQRSWQEGASLMLIERPGDRANPCTSELLAHLPAHINTLFAIPLLSGQVPAVAGASGNVSSGPDRLLGLIVGASCDTRKLRRAEIMLLDALANQASAALSISSLQKEKRRLDRLASLGEMAAGVAHEVRNPLAGIKYSLQMVMQDLASEGQQDTLDDVQASVVVALKEIERLDGIVRDLLSFAKPRRPRYTPCDLPSLIDRVLSLLQSHCIEAGIVVARRYSPLPTFWADSLQIEQVLLNLLHNAIQAMSSGGTLSVSCGVQAPGGEDRWIELTIGDTGCGIAREQLERIFQPFFTTRAHGIGLGLSITRRLIEDHGGRIGVESCMGHGTTVSVWLPLHSHDPV